MKTFLFAGLIVALTLLSSSCELLMPERDSLKVINTTNKHILCYFGLGGQHGTLYPDTNLPSKDTYVIDIPPNDYYHYFVSSPWQEVYTQFPSGIFSVYIIDADTVAKYGWDDVRRKNNIVRRYDLSLQDITNKNHVITYP